MKVRIISFNDSINSKSGAPIPKGKPRRGTLHWAKFESIMISCLEDLGHDVDVVKENPRLPVVDDGRFTIAVHRTKRELPFAKLFYMQMHLSNMFTLDPNGWGADASQKPSKEDIELVPDENVDEIKELSDRLHHSGLSKCHQPSNKTLIWDKGVGPVEFILVPIQTPRDYVLKHHSPITMRYFLDCMESFANQSGTHIAFKLHPFNQSDHDLHAFVSSAVSSRYCHSVQGNIHEVIKRATGVFTINSGVGFEALIHGKPVATFGDCDYRYATYNADVRSTELARNHVYDYTAANCSMAYKFIWWYLNKYAYDVNDININDRLKVYLKGVVR